MTSYQVGDTVCCETVQGNIPHYMTIQSAIDAEIVQCIWFDSSQNAFKFIKLPISTLHLIKTSNDALKIGDRVMLKSGGPKMYVMSFNDGGAKCARILTNGETEVKIFVPSTLQIIL